MPNSTCPACGADAFVTQADGGTCTRCGYSAGESNRCPHCGSIARIEGSGESAICAVCGGPRVGGGFGGDSATAALREQKRHLAVARAASIATVLQAVVAAMVTSIGLAILPAAILGKAIVVVLAVAPDPPRAPLSRTCKGCAFGREGRGERAWQAAAEDAAARSKAGVTAAALAKMLGISPERADELLTSLAVHDRTRVEVGEDAEVRYSVKPEALVRVGEASMPPEVDEHSEEDRQERAR